VAKIVRLVLDDLPSHPLSRKWRELAEKLANDLGAELKVIEEDYMYAMEHGDTDEFGMTWLPQLFAEDEEGKVYLVMSRFPFEEKTGSPDPERAYEEAKARLEEILSA